MPGKIFRAFALLAVALCATCMTLPAQTATGRVIGTVRDAQGAVIPGAQVTVTNTANGTVNTTVTDGTGHYEVLALPVGMYKVSVTKAGFKSASTDARPLQINESLRLDMTLSVGEATETVTVSSAGANVETVNPTIGETVTGAAVAELPLNGRNVMQLATLQPGVTAQNPGAIGNGFSISGGRTDATTFLLDGGLNTNLMTNSLVMNPNPDAVAEFRILTSNYTAEYGRNAGGIISVVTKSGTNQLHGSAYDYIRNDAFNANSYFNILTGQSRNVLKRHQYGGTLGGPVVIPKLYNGKDRLFFFVSFQGQQQSAAVSQNQIPTFTPAELGGDFSSAPAATKAQVANFLLSHSYFQSNSALAAQGTIDPTRIDPVSQGMIAAHLIPTSPAGLLSSSASSTDNYNELMIKTDYVLSEIDRFSSTLSFHRENQLIPYGDGYANVPGYNDTTLGHNYFGSLGYIRMFTPKLLNDLRFSIARRYLLQDQPVETNLPRPSDLGIQINPDLPFGPPYLNFADAGLLTGLGGNGPTYFKDNTFTLTDTLTWTRGEHNLKFGIYISPFRDSFDYVYVPNGGYTFASYGSASTGSDFADFLLGLPANFEQGPGAHNDVRSKSIAAFGQDEWRVTPRVTLTVGLRYEYNQPKTDTKGRTVSIIPGFQSTRYSTAPVGLAFPGDAGAPKGLTFPDRNNFAPRFGFAWDPSGSDKTSVRGGFGVFFDILNGHDNIDGNGGQPFAAYGYLTLPSLPAGYNQQVQFMTNPWGSSGIPNPFPVPKTITNWGAIGFLPFGVSTTDPHMVTPYVYQYNLSVQQALPSSLIAELNYVGSNSKKLQTNRASNPMILGTTNRPLNLNQTNPDVISFCNSFAAANGLSNPASACPFQYSEGVNTNGGFETYNSLQASLRRQFSDSPLGHIFFTLSYTYAHSIDDTSGRANVTQGLPYYNPEAYTASSDFDVRHTIAFSGGWTLPFDRMWQSGPKRLIGDWSLYPILSWRTGFPLNVNAGLSGSSETVGPSGAGDPGNVNALLAQGITSVHTSDPRKSSNQGYFSPTTFTNAQWSSSTPCSQQDASEFPSDNCSITVPGLRTYGSGRNIFAGPGRTNLDLALAKQIKITERVNAQLRLEAFNALNHAQWSSVNTNIYSSLFGQVTSTYDPRIVQVALRIRF